MLVFRGVKVLQGESGANIFHANTEETQGIHLNKLRRLTVWNPCWTFENLREPLGHKITAPSWTWVGGSEEGAPSLIACAESLSGFLTQPRQQMTIAKAKTGMRTVTWVNILPGAMMDSFPDRHRGESGVRKARWVTDYILSFKKSVLYWYEWEGVFTLEQREK